MTELNYEPRVILEHANRLNRRADSMGVTSAVIGGLIGGFFGAVPLTSLGDSWPIPHPLGFATLLAGILVGALTGYVIGDARAFGYRLQAQSSLCQLHLERNTAALLSDAYSTAVSAAQPEPPAAPAFEYVQPAPEPAPIEEMHVPEYVTPEPEYFALEPELEPESPSFVNARIAAYLEPAPDPAPEAPAAFVPEYVEPAFAPEPAPEPTPEPVLEAAPEPAPFVEGPTLVPARLADPLPADLNSLSLEEIAQLAKTGQI